MMTAPQLLDELGRLGVHLDIVGGRIAYKAPKGALTPQLKQMIDGRRTELVLLLSRERADDRSEPMERLMKSHEQRSDWLRQMLTWLIRHEDHLHFAEMEKQWEVADDQWTTEDGIVRCLRRRGYAPITTDLFDDVIVLLRDDTVQVPGKWSAAVTYTLGELETIRGMSPDDFRMLHEVKKTFGGRVVHDAAAGLMGG